MIRDIQPFVPFGVETFLEVTPPKEGEVSELQRTKNLGRRKFCPNIVFGENVHIFGQRSPDQNMIIIIVLDTFTTKLVNF